MTFIITRGYPASGKTTRALRWVDEDPTKRVRVNRDDLRQTLFGKVVGVDEKTVTIAQRAAVEALLKAGKDVIVDDTSLRLRTAREWNDLAVKHGHEFRVWDVETDVETCVLRNAQRAAQGGREVPEAVIRDFAKRFPLGRWGEVKPTERKHSDPPARFEPDYTLPPAIIVDLDGTYAHNVSGREFFGEGLKRVKEDVPDINVQNVVEIVWANLEYDVIFMSGRNEFARKDTEEWLFEHGLWEINPEVGVHLFMRPDGDSRADFKVKADLFEEHVRGKFDVKFALDDRDQIVRLWRDMGIPCWQVASGDF